MGDAPTRKPACGACRFFRNDPAYLEAAFPGMASMGSGHASVKADDGICLRHDRYHSAHASCDEFASTSCPNGGPSCHRLDSIGVRRTRAALAQILLSAVGGLRAFALALRGPHEMAAPLPERLDNDEAAAALAILHGLHI